MKISNFLFFCFLLVPACQHADTVSNTHEFKLDNGLTLVVQEDHRAPVVNNQVWYKVGGSYEENGITGISHVLEHMMFRGTKLYPENQFSQLVAFNGALQNAFTSYDYTAYFQEGDVANLKLFLKLEANRMRNLVIKKEAFKKELQVVLEERHLRIDDNPEALLRERFLATAHIRNPYHHPTIGWRDDIQNLTEADLRRWYETWYQPNNATVVIVGDVNPEEVFKWVKEYFGTFNKSVIPTLKPRKEIKPLGKQQIEIHIAAKVPRIIMGYRVPSVKTAENKKDIYALLVLLTILDGGESSRLTKNLLRKEGLITEITSYYNPYLLHDTLMSFSTIPASSVTFNKIQEKIIEQINRIKNEPPSEKELDKAKINLIAENTLAKDSLSRQAYEIGMLESIGLSWREKTAFVKNINSVNAKEVQAVANKFLIEDRLTVAELIPNQKEP